MISSEHRLHSQTNIDVIIIIITIMLFFTRIKGTDVDRFFVSLNPFKISKNSLRVGEKKNVKYPTRVHGFMCLFK